MAGPSPAMTKERLVRAPRNDVSMKSQLQRNHARVNAIEAVMRLRLARIAPCGAAIDPIHSRLTASPADEGRKARGLGEVAAAVTVLNHQGARQLGRRAENGDHILLSVPRFGRQKS